MLKSVKKISLFVLIIYFVCVQLISCKKQAETRIFLFGEVHSRPIQQEKELENWGKLYEQGLRHLFIESGYPSAQLKNRWMKSDSDDYFNLIFENTSGTAGNSETTWNFYHIIKEKYPETIFHGIDVEHQYKTTGQYYLDLLKSEGLEDSEEYKICVENMKQAEIYCSTDNEPYRENCMVQNFVREFDSLPADEKIMGICGSAHSGLKSRDWTGKIPCMANQLNRHYKKLYGSIIESTDLSYLQDEIEPISVTEFEIKGKTYKASYFGEFDMSDWHETFRLRRFWRIENPGKDFKKYLAKLDFLPYENYPTAVHKGDVFRIEYERYDGSKQIYYYRSDGKKLKKYGYITSFLFSE